MENKIFSPHEANAMLPELKNDLSRLQDLTIEFERMYRDLQAKKAAHAHKESYQPASSGRELFFEEESRIEFMRMEVDLQIDNFARKGVLLKRISPGLIDFPAVVDGENVLICWMEGEDRISHYHGWNEGFAGRRPLPDA